MFGWLPDLLVLLICNMVYVEKEASKTLFRKPMGNVTVIYPLQSVV